MSRRILASCALRNRAPNSASVMLFDINDGFRPLCVGGNLECLEAHDVVNGLDCYVAGQSCGDDSC